jgi:Flp pilus assembly protein TadG
MAEGSPIEVVDSEVKGRWTMRRSLREKVRRGATAVEMAVISPVFLALVLGILEASRVGMVVQLLTTAAREGCRVAVLDGMTQTDVQNRIDAVLSGSGISVGTVNPTPSTWTTASSGTAITVSLSVPYSQMSWLKTSMFFPNTTLSASATLSSERP